MGKTFDVIIIGGGPGGYVAAIRARQLGLSTALVEAQQLGGVCLNWGCIPTKSLLKSGHLFQSMAGLDQFGITARLNPPDLPCMVARSRSIADQLAKGIAYLLNKNGVCVYQTRGSLQGRTAEGDHRIALENEQPIVGRHVILATGARPRTLPAVSGLEVWSSREAMIPTTLPSSLLVIGGGAIGIEFASFYNALGVSVTVVEQASCILPTEDEEVQKAMHEELVRQGMTIWSGHVLTQGEKMPEGSFQAILTELASGKTHLWQGDQILVAIGVEGCIEGLGLEQTRIRLHKGHIVTNAYGQTDEEGIYAIGDVAGAPWLAHKASREGEICVELIAGRSPKPLDRSVIPGCIYSSPQVASLGLTEQEARKQGIEVKIGRFPFSANGQALAQGSTRGFIKVLFERQSGELLGAHMVGAIASELIQGFVVAKVLEATEEDLHPIIFAHPTLSEGLGEAILDADHRAIHVFRP